MRTLGRATIFFFFAISLSELAARVFIKPNFFGDPDNYLMVVPSQTPGRVYELRPNYEGDYVFGKRQTATIKTNSLGFRDREFNLDKSNLVKRTLVLGDSIGFGFGLEEDQSMPKQLERLLGKGHEVFNLSLPGYDLAQEVATLGEYRSKLNPDQVLFLFCLNDLTYASVEAGALKQYQNLSPLAHLSRLVRMMEYNFETFKGMTFEELSQITQTGLSDINNDTELLSRMQLFEAERQRLIKDNTLVGSEAILVHFLAVYGNEKYVSRFRWILERLKSLKDESDLKISFVLFPLFTGPKTTDLTQKMTSIVQYELARAGFTDSLDLFPSMSLEGLDRLKLPVEGNLDHPNELGDSLAARAAKAHFYESNYAGLHPLASFGLRRGRFLHLDFPTLGNLSSDLDEGIFYSVVKAEWNNRKQYGEKAPLQNGV